MSIYINEQDHLIYLHTPKTSYVMQIVDGRFLAHVYWGRRVSGGLQRFIHYAQRPSFSPNWDSSKSTMTLDTLPQEYPTYGTGDFRHPALELRYADGSSATELEYVTHRINKGKPGLEGLPAVYVEQDEEADTLEIELQDRVSRLKVILQYSVYQDRDVITRSARIINENKYAVRLEAALSAAVDFHHDQYEMIHLAGTWAKERHVKRTPLTDGAVSIESRRGASGHEHNPFLALISPDATETSGEAYGFSFVYSGSFVGRADVDQYGTTRVAMGINPFDFSWLLNSGESFQTPEVVMVYSHEGIGEMSRTYHRLYRERLCRGLYRDEVRPVKVNNWEATYFSFNADKLAQIGSVASELDIEMFVLDDGWFGKRDSDNSSLGDWVEDRKKLPNGLHGVYEDFHTKNLKFGLWFEPEMVSPDSDLFRAHPDWCLHVEGRRRTEGRRQLVLDFSRSEVCDYIYNQIALVLESTPIVYVKWDMNRNMTEIGSPALPPERQRETAHRYMLNLYDMMEKLTNRFPHILFESCSGGGGRFDPGMLYYMPQTWTSDNTDAIARLAIQHGTSLVYPASAMGSHVSAVPNHIMGRTTPLQTRGHVSMAGVLGYELDLTKLTDEEKKVVSEQVELYKSIRSIVLFGDQYRLVNPTENGHASWMYVSRDKTQAVWTYVSASIVGNGPIPYVRMQGLDPAKRYEVLETGELYQGDELMYAGMPVKVPHGDFGSIMWRLKAVQ